MSARRGPVKRGGGQGLLSTPPISPADSLSSPSTSTSSTPSTSTPSPQPPSQGGSPLRPDNTTTTTTNPSRFTFKPNEDVQDSQPPTPPPPTTTTALPSPPTTKQPTKPAPSIALGLALPQDLAEAKMTQYFNGPHIKPYKLEVYQELRNMHDLPSGTAYERAMAANVGSDILSDVSTSNSRVETVLQNWDESDKRWLLSRRALGNEFGRKRWESSPQKRDIIDREYGDKVLEDGRRVLYLYDNWGYMPLNPILAMWLSRQGFYTPSECQAQTIMPLLRRRNVAVQALSGMGKTLCFQLPLLQNVRTGVNETQAVIVVPTKELADQTEVKFKEFLRFIRSLKEEADSEGRPAGEDLLSFSRLRVCKALPQGEITDQLAWRLESQMLEDKDRPHIIISTPGHLFNLVEPRTIRVKGETMVKPPLVNLSHEQFMYFIMDEADDMLVASKLGVRKQVDYVKPLLTHLHPNRTIGLFSATYTKTSIEGIVEVFSPSTPTPTPTPTTKFVEFTLDWEHMIRRNIFQIYQTHHTDDAKMASVHKMLDGTIFLRDCKVYIFCEKEETVEKVVRRVVSMGLSNEVTTTSPEFRDGSKRIFVCTNAGARGLDVRAARVVINWDLPMCEYTFTQRVGRVGRFGLTGVAVSFFHDDDKEEMKLLAMLQEKRYSMNNIQEFPFHTLTEVGLARLKAPENHREYRQWSSQYDAWSRALRLGDLTGSIIRDARNPVITRVATISLHQKRSDKYQKGVTELSKSVNAQEEEAMRVIRSLETQIKREKQALQTRMAYEEDQAIEVAYWLRKLMDQISLFEKADQLARVRTCNNWAQDSDSDDGDNNNHQFINTGVL